MRLCELTPLAGELSEWEVLAILKQFRLSFVFILLVKQMCYPRPVYPRIIHIIQKMELQLKQKHRHGAGFHQHTGSPGPSVCIIIKPVLVFLIYTRSLKRNKNAEENPDQ